MLANEATNNIGSVTVLHGRVRVQAEPDKGVPDSPPIDRTGLPRCIPRAPVRDRLRPGNAAVACAIRGTSGPSHGDQEGSAPGREPAAWRDCGRASDPAPPPPFAPVPALFAPATALFAPAPALFALALFATALFATVTLAPTPFAPAMSAPASWAASSGGTRAVS